MESADIKDRQNGKREQGRTDGMDANSTKRSLTQQSHETFEDGLFILRVLMVVRCIVWYDRSRSFFRNMICSVWNNQF